MRKVMGIAVLILIAFFILITASWAEPKGVWVLKNTEVEEPKNTCPQYSRTYPNCVAVKGAPGNLIVRTENYTGSRQAEKARITEYKFNWSLPPATLTPGEILPLKLTVKRLEFHNDLQAQNGDLSAKFNPEGARWNVQGSPPIVSVRIVNNDGPSSETATGDVPVPAPKSLFKERRLPTAMPPMRPAT